jgi:hypothetical protein
MARTGPAAMSAVQSLSEEKRTWHGPPNLVEIDPTETLAVHCDMALMPAPTLRRLGCGMDWLRYSRLGLTRQEGNSPLRMQIA